MYQYSHGLFLCYFPSTLYDCVLAKNTKVIKYYSWSVARPYFIYFGKKCIKESSLQVIWKKYGKAWTRDSWSEKEVILEASWSGNQKNPPRTRKEVFYI